MTKVLNKVGKGAKNVAVGTLKFGTAAAIGVVGTGVGVGVKARKKMNTKIDGFCEGLELAILDEFSGSKMMEIINKKMYEKEHSQKGRNGIDYSMLSTFSNDAAQYGA